MSRYNDTKHEDGLNYKVNTKAILDDFELVDLTKLDPQNPVGLEASMYFESEPPKFKGFMRVRLVMSKNSNGVP